ncbi:MAG: nitroreductase family protein [Treponema sp.]|nr:nitroreductase family protein [Treponema sp.]
MEFKSLIEKRHRVRTYLKEEVSDEILNEPINCAKLAPTSRNKKPVDYIVVKDRELLTKLSVSKAGGSQKLKDAGAAIVVIGDSEKSDVWIEDCSIAMTYLHLAAVNYGLGSCWIQIRNRQNAEGKDSGEYIKELLGINAPFEVLAVLSLGNIQVD